MVSLWFCLRNYTNHVSLVALREGKLYPGKLIKIQSDLIESPTWEQYNRRHRMFGKFLKMPLHLTRGLRNLSTGFPFRLSYLGYSTRDFTCFLSSFIRTKQISQVTGGKLGFYYFNTQTTRSWLGVGLDILGIYILDIRTYVVGENDWQHNIKNLNQLNRL